MPDFFFTIFGLRVASHRDIPGFEPAPPDSPPDVEIWFQQKPAWVRAALATQAEPWFHTPGNDANGKPVLQVWKRAADAYFHYRYCDDVEFILDRGGTKIWAGWPPEQSFEDATVYLAGPILGFLLRLRGTVCLHASAVRIGAQAVALVGGPGAGKSTTAAGFAQQGWPVLSDDVVALHDRGPELLVLPASPFLKLTPAAVTGLWGSGDALPLVAPNWEKRYLDLSAPGYKFERQPAPLGAIYFLDARTAPGPEGVISDIAPQDAFITLVANTYTNYLLDPPMRRLEFEVLSRIVNRVPLRQVNAHSDSAHLRDFCRNLVRDFETLTAKPAK